MIIANRLQNLRQALAAKASEAILISQPETRLYLSGFDGSAGYLLITPQAAILATDFRYIEQAKAQAPDYEIRRLAGDAADWLPGLATELELGDVAFEAANITVTQYGKLNDALDKSKTPTKLTPLEELVEPLRAVKEPEEIKLITQAAELADAAYEYVEAKIKAGMTEKEIAWEIEKTLRERGSQTIPFDIIVASGPNAALPHARPTSRVIGNGEPIVIDMGARIDGYCSDLSRTLCPGKRDDRFNEVYDIVLKAQQAAISSIKEGVTGEKVDAAARKYIEDAGYGEAFGHVLGHGVGLAAHELPHIAPNSSEPLIDGMIFTVEPGIYLAGWGGVRIEDMVLMENGEARVLSQARRI
ncbi:aminopeptidase P family protein [Chloroflexota bacterium]